ncbi:MAG: insulinase family protein [Clostridiales Family XIII bacterium]|jgi:predicted Zn-dependent peptidase|nr:insulinase family protein [Clostridiales Family XIII bacterium]
MIKIKNLQCGLRLVTEELPYVKSVSVGVWVRAGAVFETPRNAGISHYIEHMLFKGTEKRSAKQIAEDVDRIGGQINAFTGKEATCYYMKTLSTNFAKGAEILSDMLLNSQFAKEEMDKERHVICEEIKMNEDSPEDVAHDLICEEVFHGSSLAKNVIGTPSSLKTVSSATMRAYMKRLYTKENILLSVAGNFDEAAVCETLERLFESLPSGTPDLTLYAADYTPRFRSKVKDIEQSHICIGTKSIALEDERYYSLSVLNNIMGSSMSSRLFQNIREQKGLAYAVYSANNSFSGDGFFNIYAGVSHDKVKKAVEGILEELLALKKDGVTEDELATAKEQMKGQYIFSQENVNGRMFSIGKNMLLLNRVYTPEEIMEKLDNVSMEQVRGVSGLITDPDAYTGVLVGGKRQSMKELMRRFTLAV